MSKVIYHAGTGTYFGAEDEAFIIDLDKLPDDFDDLNELDWDIVEPHAIPVVDYISLTERL